MTSAERVSCPQQAWLALRKQQLLWEQVSLGSVGSDQGCWPGGSGEGSGAVTVRKDRASKAARGEPGFALLPVVVWKGGDPKVLLFLAWQEFCSSDTWSSVWW